MAEEQSRRIEDAMKKIVSELDKNYLRRIQANMHRCAARCCDNSIDSMENVHNCVQNCSASLNEAQEYVQTELSSVQNRLQRCVLDCSDSIKDKMGPSPSESEVKRYNADFENCAVKCVDRHVELLPTMLARMKEVLGKNYQKNLNVSL